MSSKFSIHETQITNKLYKSFYYCREKKETKEKKKEERKENNASNDVIMT